MNETTELIEFEWPGVHPLQLNPPMRAWTQDFAKLGYPLSFLAATYQQGVGSFYVLKHEFESRGYAFFEHTKQNPQLLRDILREVNGAADAIFKIGRKWNRKNLETLTTAQLLHLHKELFEQAEILWRKGQIQNLLELYNSYLTPYIRSLIKKYFSAKKEMEVFTALTTGLYESKMEQQDIDFGGLIKISHKLKFNALDKHPSVIAHWHKYTWMTYGWEGPALGLDYFVTNIIEAKKSTKITRTIIENLNVRKKLRKKQSDYLKIFPRKEMALVELLRELLDSKAKRVDAHSQSYFLGDKILRELGRRKNLSMNQMRMIDPLHFATRYQNASSQELNEEYKLVILVYERGKGLKKLTGKRAQAYFIHLKSLVPKVKAANILKGDTAYPGKVKGKVRVVLYVPDSKIFEPGEILITRITDPTYVPIMKKAAAIVTDIGGITCHAAIVSRELKKPCVIGTKHATQIFKDGDTVEVDATKGVVRKIK